MGGTEHYVLNWIWIVVISQILAFASSRSLVRLNQRWSKSGGINAHLNGFRRIFIGATLSSALIIVLLSLEIAFRNNGINLFPTAVIVVLLAFGIVAPCFETLLHAYIPVSESAYRATIMSAGSMFRSLMILILAVPSGGTSSETTPIYWSIPASILLVASFAANHFMKKGESAVTAMVPAAAPLETSKT